MATISYLLYEMAMRARLNAVSLRVYNYFGEVNTGNIDDSKYEEILADFMSIKSIAFLIKIRGYTREFKKDYDVVCSNEAVESSKIIGKWRARAN